MKALFSTGLLMGCLWAAGSSGHAAERPAEKPHPAAATAPVKASDKPAAEAAVETPLLASDSVQLEPGDRLRFRIKEDPAAPKQATALLVGALGDIEFPITAGGSTTVTLNLKAKTLGQARADLIKKLEEDYYVKATVELTVEDRTQKGGQVMIFGEVRASKIPLPPGEKRTILDVILDAGPTEFANLKKVKLLRLDPATKKSIPKIIDVEKIKKGDENGNVYVLDGDKIEVPARSFNF